MDGRDSVTRRRPTSRVGEVFGESGRLFCSGRLPAVTGWLLSGFLVVVCAVDVFGQAPRVLSEGERVDDARLSAPKDLDGYFPFSPPASRDLWEARRVQLRRHLQVALGLWPLPTETSLNAVVHGKMDQGDYTIEKVYFESLPGFYVTGSLYRPKNVTGRAPGILCPHGHWANGRFYDCGESEVKAQIAAGAETFAEGGRSPLQSRCVHLARMGAVVFHYDMIGYADSQQISYEVAHRFAKQRPEMNSDSNWGLFSPQAESHLQSVMGLQTYNSIRALDFLESLSDVDPERLAVTGASGGGTQTFILAALDDRLKTAFPAVMVSTAMQGGCTCENCSLLRVGTGNVEIAALFAPKPMGMTAADDWTKEMTTKGFPQLKELYGLYGAADRVHLTSRTEFGHNYNQVGREAMYRVFQPVLGLAELFEESAYERLSSEDLTVWDDAHPQPAGGDDVERKILASWLSDSHKQLTGVVPKTVGDYEEFQRVVGGGIESVIGRSISSVGLSGSQVTWDLVDKTDRETWVEMAGWIKSAAYHETLPVVFCHPKTWNGEVVVWLGGQGKDALYGADGGLTKEVKQLVDGGYSVLGADLLFQGEFLEDGQSLEQTRRVANPREAAAYTFGYNPSLAARRAHDVLTLVSYLTQQSDYEIEAISLVGVDRAGPVVATAAAVLGDSVARVCVATGGFRYGDVSEIHSPDFLPGGAKYFDLPGFLAVSQTPELLVAGEDDSTLKWIGGCRSAASEELVVQGIEAQDVGVLFVKRLLGDR